MGCCNQPPRGGTSNLGGMIKMIVILMAVVFVIAWLFG